MPTSARRSSSPRRLKAVPAATDPTMAGAGATLRSRRRPESQTQSARQFRERTPDGTRDRRFRSFPGSGPTRRPPPAPHKRQTPVHRESRRVHPVRATLFLRIIPHDPLRGLDGDLPFGIGTMRWPWQCAHGGEQNYVPDVALIGQQHRQAVDADTDTTGGRHAVHQRVDVVLVNGHRFLVTRLPVALLLDEAGKLIEGVVQLGESVCDLTPSDVELEPFYMCRVARLALGQRRELDGVV